MGIYLSVLTPPPPPHAEEEEKGRGRERDGWERLTLVLKYFLAVPINTACRRLFLWSTFFGNVRLAGDRNTLRATSSVSFLLQHPFHLLWFVRSAVDMT